MFKIVKCPDSATLELVECVETPLGHLIHRCTRFRPTCAMHCTRQCAADLDAEQRGPIRSSSAGLVLDFDLDVS